jgi:hypothetical protein
MSSGLTRCAAPNEVAFRVGLQHRLSPMRWAVRRTNYKAHWHRPKGEHDFVQARAHLSAAQRNWPRAALPAHYPDDPRLAELA